MFRRLYLFPVLIVLFLFSSNAQGQNKIYGAPLIKNYYQEDYDADAQIWSVLQDDKGMMYFGSNRSMLAFDGVDWTKYYLKNKSQVRALALGDSGKIFVGGSNEFGFFSPARQGDLVYTSLADYLPDSISGYQNIWRVHVAAGTVYFTSFDYLFVWENQKLNVYHGPFDPFFSFLIGHRLYVMHRTKGFSRFEGGEFLKLPGLDTLNRNFGFMYAEEFDQNSILFSAYTYGLAFYNLQSKQLNEIKLDETVHDYLTENIFFSAHKISKNKIAIATQRGGILLINSSGQLLQVLNFKRGLISDDILDIYIDDEQHLWVATQMGISRVDLNIPVQHYGVEQGIKWSIIDIAQHDDRIFLGTMGHTLMLQPYKLAMSDDNHKFKSIDKIGYCWNFVKYGNKLFAMGSNTVTEVSSGKDNHKYVFQDQVMSGMYSEKYPDILFVGLSGGFCYVKLKNDKFPWGNTSTKPIFFNKITEEIRDIEIDIKGNLWLTTNNSGPILIRVENYDLANYQITKFNSQQGLPKDLNMIRTKLFNNRLNFFTAKGVYKIRNPESVNSADSSVEFIQDKLWGKPFTADSTEVYKIEQISDDRFIILNSDNIGIVDIGGDRVVFNTSPFKRFKNIESVKVLDNNRLAFADVRNLYLCDVDKIVVPKSKFNVLIRKVYAGKDSVLLDGYYLNNRTIKADSSVFKLNPILDYKDNNISFHYTGLFYEEPKQIKYTHRLLGYNSEWSAPSYEHSAGYTNLTEGEYDFQVKAINVYGNESYLTSYKFSVLPPWYRTWWAFVLYVAGFVVFVMLLVFIFIRRLQKINRWLEEKVKERTQMISGKNEELEIQKGEIEEQRDAIYFQASFLTKTNKELKMLSAVAKETDNAVLICNSEGEITWVNDGFTRIMGYTLEQFRNEVSDNFLDSSFTGESEKPFFSAKLLKQPDTYESKVLTRDGSEIYFHTTLSPVVGDKNRVEQIIVLNSDITILKKTEKELQGLNETKDKLFSIIAHDLKNPFNSLLGISELLVSDYDDLPQESILKLLKGMNQSAQRGYDLLVNLLEWAGVQTGRLELNPKPIQIKSIVADSMELLSNVAKEKNIKLVNDVDSESEAYIDKNSVSTVIRNLMSNALKFTERNGRIVVSGNIQAEQVIITVEDNGIGIKPEVQDKLFKVGEDISSKGTENESGTGLGLLLCKEFVEKNNGTIRVDSTVGKGSKFIFSLPKSR